MSHRATVSQLESDFADAMNRMYAVGNGLARLRAELDREAAARHPVAAAPPTPAPAPVPAPRPASPMPGWAPPAGPPPAPVPTAPAVPFVPWYRREGVVTRVLAVSGAVVTMAGVAMLLVLAAQQGWFGPPARVASGAVLAGVLAWLGVRGGEADRRAGTGVGSAPVALVATGAAAAYLDVVAVTSGYGWLGPAGGLALAGLVAGAGLHLARRWGSELLAVLLVAGAAGLAPVVAGGNGWVVSAFLAVLCVAGWWGGGAHARPALTLVRVLPVTFSLLAGAVADPVLGTGGAWGRVAVAVTVLAATLATSTASVRRDAGDVTASVAVALLGTGLLATLAPLTDPTRTVLLGGCGAALLVVATTLARRPVGPLAGHLVATVATLGTLLAVLAVVSGAPERFVSTGLLLLAVAALAVAGANRSRLALALAAAVSLVAVLAWAQHPLATVAAPAAARHDMVVALVDSILVAALVAVGLWAVGTQRGLGRDVRLAATVTAWVLGLGASTTVLVALGTLLGAQAGQAALGFTVGHAAATVTWMLAAAWLLLRGLERTRDADLTLRTGLLLAGVSVAKLFLFDLAALSGLVRSVAFIVTGLLLLATGSRYAKAWERRRATA